MTSCTVPRAPVAAAESGGLVVGIIRKRGTPGSLNYPSPSLTRRMGEHPETLCCSLSPA